MLHRSVTPVAATALLVSTMLALIGAQSPSPPPQSIPTRTPWGHPDLQGIWTTETLTPLERPADLLTKSVLTEKEAAELERRTDASRADGPPREGDPGTYNRFWSEAGARVVSGRRTSLIIDPPNGRIPWRPGKREESDRIEASYGQGPFASYTDLDTGERCITDGPTLVPLQGYNMNFEIVQSPDHVAVLHEMFHQYTVIPIDGRPHVGKGLGQWLGDARGHWEGNTLVVETTNFADLANYRWARLWRSARPTLRLVERFTRIDDDTIDYRFTVQDPTLFTQPWTAAIPMTRIRGQVYEYACHEGNYSLRNVLSGARARDSASK